MFTLKNIISVLKTSKKPLYELKYLLDKYNYNDWKEYRKLNDNTYEKNLIFRNKDYEMFLICWNKNQFSGIHNHSENGCIYKVVEGQLSEFLYDPNNLNLKQSTSFNTNSVGYIDDNIGYHKMGNDLRKPACSIHIYSPPNFVPFNFKN